MNICTCTGPSLEKIVNCENGGTLTIGSTCIVCQCATGYAGRYCETGSNY